MSRLSSRSVLAAMCSTTSGWYAEKVPITESRSRMSTLLQCPLCVSFLGSAISRFRTFHVLSRNLSTRLVPIKPEPPVTITLMVDTSGSHVGKFEQVYHDNLWDKLFDCSEAGMSTWRLGINPPQLSKTTLAATLLVHLTYEHIPYQSFALPNRPFIMFSTTTHEQGINLEDRTAPWYSITVQRTFKTEIPFFHHTREIHKSRLPLISWFEGCFNYRVIYALQGFCPAAHRVRFVALYV